MMRPILTAPALLLLALFSVAPILTAGPSPQQQDLSRFEGRLIDSIEVDNRNIFDLEDPAYDNFLFRTANRFHMVTRKAIIRQEILLSVGGPFSVNLAEESARNMRGRLALYDAWVEVEELADGGLLVRFITVDEWSLSGGFRFARDGNLNRIRFGLAERNLVGRGIQLEANYHIEDGKSNYLTSSFSENRLLGRELSISGAYSGNPEARRLLLGIGHPYYDLMQKWKWEVSGGATSDLKEIYSDDRLIADSDNDGDRLSTTIGFRFGDYDRKLELEGLYDYVYKEIEERRIYSTESIDSALAEENFPTDSAFHRIGLRAGLLVHDYVSLRRIDGFGVTEDFRVGPSLRASVSYAFSHDTTAFNQAGVGIGWAGYGRQTLFSATGETVAWHNRSGQLVRRLYALRLWLYNRSIPKTTLAFNARFLKDQPIGGINQLVLGGTTGLRGYDKYFMTGDRRLAANFEARFLPGLEILSVQFGTTMFVDFGQIWKYGEELGLDHSYAAVGIGLRVSGERSSRSALARLDLSYSKTNGWQVSVGSGQYFGASGSSLPLTTY